MKTISATRARRHWSNLLGQVQFRGERFGIVRSGSYAAALIPFEDAEQFRAQADEGDIALARAAVASNRPQPRTAWADLKAYLDLD